MQPPVVTTSTAEGTVFLPNPVQQLGLQDLTDNKDADGPVFGPAYRRVTLTDLDGSGSLTGRYVVVKSKTGKPAAVAVSGAFPESTRSSTSLLTRRSATRRSPRLLQHNASTGPGAPTR